MSEPRATRRRVMPDVTDLKLPDIDPAPKPEPMKQERGVRVEHMAIVDTWFANGCLSKREAIRAHGLASPPGLIFGRPEVDAYVRECMAQRQQYLAKSEAEIIREYEKIGFANFGDILEVQPDGSAYVDMTNLTPDLRAAIAEYQVETYNEMTIENGEAVHVPVKKARIKFHDKKAALDSLSRIHGMNKDKVEVSGVDNLIRGVAEARKRLGQQKEPEA